MNDQPKNKPQKIGVIIQARQTSKRFPGKSMAILQGKPVLEHVIRNASLIKPTHQVIVAVPDTVESEPMLQLAHRLGIDNFVGSEEDVLGRYYNAARFFNLDVIIRITADCPFLNPKVCSEVLQVLLFRKCDYTSNVYPTRSYPLGLDCEAFTMDCLEAAHGATLGSDALPGDREHVTPWMQRTQGLRRALIQQAKDASHINMCVDFPEDIERLNKYQMGVWVP